MSRFLARHHRINRVAQSALKRIVRRAPIVSKFLAFFVPDELTLKVPTPAPEEIRQTAAIEPPHIAPVYNARARKPKGPTFG